MEVPKYVTKEEQLKQLAEENIELRRELENVWNDMSAAYQKGVQEA